MSQAWKKYSYIATIVFFALGFLNIIFAWLGFACMIMPFVFLVKNGRKTWCHNYCSSGSLLNQNIGILI